MRDFGGAANIRASSGAVTGLRTLQAEVKRLVDRDGVICRREHPELAGAIAWLMRTEELVSVLPGVYAHPAAAPSVVTRLRAVGYWDRDAVLTGAAAARVSYWPTIDVGPVVCAVGSHRPAQRGYTFVKRTVPPLLIAQRGRLRYTQPELTALDLCVETDGESIDEVLRTRSATLDHLQQAMTLTRARVGNPGRRRLLLESRTTPWSAAERRFHRLLREANITGWDANQPVIIEGSKVFPDVRFRRRRLIIEIDGRKTHSEAKVFEADRRRQNLFVVDGWCVLRFTVRMIDDEPDYVIATVRAALAMLPAQ